MESYLDYYKRQASSDDVGPIYKASYGYQSGFGRHSQIGGGIGSLFSSLFRWIRPIFVSGAKSVGREALKTGSNILTDIATKGNDVKIKDVVKTRIKEGGKRIQSNLIDQMSGRGHSLGKRRQSACSQLSAKRARKQPTSTRKPRRKRQAGTKRKTQSKKRTTTRKRRSTRTRKTKQKILSDIFSTT